MPRLELFLCLAAAHRVCLSKMCALKLSDSEVRLEEDSCARRSQEDWSCIHYPVKVTDWKERRPAGQGLLEIVCTYGTTPECHNCIGTGSS